MGQEFVHFEVATCSLTQTVGKEVAVQVYFVATVVAADAVASACTDDSNAGMSASVVGSNYFDESGNIAMHAAAAASSKTME